MNSELGIRPEQIKPKGVQDANKLDLPDGYEAVTDQEVADALSSDSDSKSLSSLGSRDDVSSHIEVRTFSVSKQTSKAALNLIKLGFDVPENLTQMKDRISEFSEPGNEFELFAETMMQKFEDHAATLPSIGESTKKAIATVMRHLFSEATAMAKTSSNPKLALERLVSFSQTFPNRIKTIQGLKKSIQALKNHSVSLPKNILKLNTKEFKAIMKDPNKLEQKLFQLVETFQKMSHLYQIRWFLN